MTDIHVGYDCPIVLRKNVKNLRKERLDKSVTFVNDTELFPYNANVLSFFVHNSNIYSVYKTVKVFLKFQYFNAPFL